MSSLTYDTIVIGGGVVGGSAAYHCVLGGASTLLVDRHHPERASDAAAGILSPETNVRDSASWFELAVLGVDYYPTLLSRIEADDGGPTGYGRCGKLLIASTDDQVAGYQAAVNVILHRRDRRARPEESALRAILPERAKELFPLLGPVKRALWHEHAARVDGRLLAAALARAATNRGLNTCVGEVDSLVTDGDRVVGVDVGTERYLADSVVITGGAWSGPLPLQLNVPIKVEPQRGQIVHLRLEGVETAAWPMIAGMGGHYIVPWPGGRVAVGATREDGSGFDARSTAEGVQECLDQAGVVAPELAEAEIIETRVGLRPVTPDLLPLIGPIPKWKGAFLAAGHGPTGLQLGPYSGKLIADLIEGKAADTDLGPFRVDRFSRR